MVDLFLVLVATYAIAPAVAALGLILLVLRWRRLRPLLRALVVVKFLAAHFVPGRRLWRLIACVGIAYAVVMLVGFIVGWAVSQQTRWKNLDAIANKPPLPRL